MQADIQQAVTDSLAAVRQLAEPSGIAFIQEAAMLLADAYRSKAKVIIAGNGGSLCDAAHFAEELTGFFRNKRRALPAISLSDPGHITCVGNDVGFDYIFSRGIEAHGEKGDIFVGLTTSGNSSNMVHAFVRAQQMGLKTVAFLGKGGGVLRGKADLELVIEGFTTSDRIQEAHMAAIHIMIEMVETLLFGEQEGVCVEEILPLVNKT